MNESGISRKTIRTDYLGPCLCFLLDFKLCGKSMCFLNHYSYPFDEDSLLLTNTLVKVLEYLFDELEDCIEREIPDEQFEADDITDATLLIAAGDPKESLRIKVAL
ncbi:unnamed protein product [Rotaria socialis]|nr:unnamed protein product [Rotaria socialis]CAF3674081.1 unnamed protein product [Rotaria socialis]